MRDVGKLVYATPGYPEPFEGPGWPRQHQAQVARFSQLPLKVGQPNL